MSERLKDGPASAREHSALRAVRSAASRHMLITPGACAQFVRHWRAERGLWVRQLAELERAFSATGLAADVSAFVEMAGRQRWLVWE